MHSFYVQDLDMVVSDCDTALNLNNKYVKALDRRARTLRKQAKKIEHFEVQVSERKNIRSYVAYVMKCFDMYGFGMHEVIARSDFHFKLLIRLRLCQFRTRFCKMPRLHNMS